MVDAETTGEEAAAYFRRIVHGNGSARLRAEELMAAFGYTDLGQEARESVADLLWEAGLLTQPPLANAGLDERSKLKIVRAEQERYAISPVGAGMAAVGGLLLGIAAFLPLDQIGGQFAYVRSNTLIQHGEWWLLVVAVAIVAAAYRSYSARKLTWDVLILGALAAVAVLFIVLNKSLRTLVPAESTGLLSAGSNETIVPFGIAVYVAGAGALLTLLGGWVMRQTAEIVSAPEQEATRRCPDCAETILVEARVCKHCGARLYTQEPKAPYPPAPAP